MTAVTKYIKKNVHLNALKAMEYTVLPKYQLRQGNTHLEA